MGKITFIEHDGTRHDAKFEVGQSLMQVATAIGVPGIDGDCGGACACGTCHVILDPALAALAGPRGEEEEQMLSLTPEREATSRLACQVKTSAAMDGMSARLPEFQM